MMTFALLDDTFWLNVTNVAMAAVTLGLVAYFAAALISGLVVARKKPAGQ